MAVPTTSAPAPRARRFDARRAELVACALTTLDELGYARTSLREIAQHSEFSHGVLHYYFTDKAELLADCMQQYRDFCAEHFALLCTAGGKNAARFADGVGELLARSLIDDAPMHRLWVDLRAQSMFDAVLQPFVDEISERRERGVKAVLDRYAELAGTSPAVSADLAEAAFDGMFTRFVLRQRVGEPGAARELAAATRKLFRVLAPATA